MPFIERFNRRVAAGLTLIELIVGVLILGILASVALPSYQNSQDQACIRQIQIDMDSVSQAIERRIMRTGDLPLDLTAIGFDGLRDCWDRPYRYKKIAGTKGKGGNRKDRSENPINSDYDLYSVGKDGRTNQSLRPRVSHDDVIRARNGSYIGLAADY